MTSPTQTTVQQFIESIPLREFPNHFAEDEFMSEAERLVRGEGSRYEAQLVKQGEERHATLKALGTESDAVAAAMKDVRARLNAGDLSPVDAFAEFERLQAAASRIVHKAVVQPSAVQGLMDKLADPLAAFANLQDKYSPLRRWYP